LIVPPGGDETLKLRLREFAAAGGRIAALGEGRPDARLVWPRERPGSSFLERHEALRPVVERAAMALYRAYFDQRAVRRLFDLTHASQRLMQGGAEYNPLFRPPAADEQAALLAALGDLAVPRVLATEPVLIEWWRQGEIDQLHLVNYADAPQDVTVELPWPVRARVSSPDTGQSQTLEGRALGAPLDVYAIFLCQRRP
jgi:hypothetical protein